MAIPSTPLTAPGSQVSYTPTGYESLSQEIQQKRAIADALTKQGLTPHQNMRSGWELLGQLAQAWAGKSIQGDADKAQTNLDQRRMADSQEITGKITAALQSGAKPQDIAAQFGAMPQAANLPIVKAMVEAAAKQFANSGEVDGAPIQLDTGNGIKSYTRMKDGTLREITQGTVANERKLGPSGQVYDPMAVTPGTALGDVSKEVYLGPDGKPVVNQALVGAKEGIARAGKTTVNTSTYVNAMDKSFGKVIPEAVMADLVKSRDAAQAYIQTKPELERAGKMLEKGIISGFGAEARLGAARAADFFGITGKNTADRVGRTQVYVQNMGRQLLPILAALRPASDTDVKTAQMMAGGDISLSPAAMRSAVNAAQQAGRTAISNHNGRVKSLQTQFGADKDIANGLGSFSVPDADKGGSLGSRAAAELARRRGEK